jgi:hypothetical protein
MVNVSMWGRVVQEFPQMGDTGVVLPVGNEVTVTHVEREKAANERALPYSFTHAPTAGTASSSSSTTANLTSAQNE